jgi:hypothetical protein
MALDDQDEVGPRSDAEAVADPSPSGVANTAARMLVLGSALTASPALDGLGEDLDQIGISKLPRYWGGAEARATVLEKSDTVLSEHGVLDAVTAAEGQRGYPVSRRNDTPLRPERVELWERAQQDGSAESAVALLRCVMTDSEAVGSSAAAVALSTWRASKETPAPTALRYARQLRRLYATGTQIGGASEIARASLGGADGNSSAATFTTFARGSAEDGPGSTASLMVHGTAAYRGQWWYPGGDFHGYVLQNLRDDLYAGGQPFTWSGAYRNRDRELAAERLAAWAGTASNSRLHTIFAHSYGGVIALEATTHGLVIDEMVLLSVPAERVAVEWRNVGRAVSLRIHLDLVLMAARRRQLFTENVEENHLPFWFWRHEYSHDPSIWKDYGCGSLLSLEETS